MKKRYIAIGVAVLIAVLLTVFALIKFKPSELPPEPTTVAFQNAQLGVTVDGWLKVIEIDEYDGRLAVEVENVSESDVEYALLTVKTKKETLTFNVSALLSGMKAMLICNESVGSDPGEVYSFWQTKDKILFDKPPVMNDGKLETAVLDGSISLKNISGEDIESEICVYYKEKKDDLVNGSVTRKVRVQGLKADSQTFIKATGLDENNCQIIFTEYDA